MAIRVETPAAKEPVPFEQLKNDIKVDSDLTADDALILGLGLAARRMAEKIQNRALITQTLELSLDAWPAVNWIKIPRPPLQSITSIKYYDQDDTEETLDSGSYFVDTASEPGRVVLNYGESWPTVSLRPANAVIVQYVAGYGDDSEDVPETTKQAIRLLVGHWHENREAVSTSGAVPKDIPFGVQALLWLERVDIV
jgi:uncharacterized phiE125 gp8 family phage protein